MRALGIGVLLGLGAVAAACGRQTAPAHPTPVLEPLPAVEVTGAGPVAASFRHVNLHVDDGIVLEVSRLDGALVSARPGGFPVLDDPHSFTVHIDSGEVALSPRSLSTLLNQHVFAYDGAPLKNIELSIEAGHLKLKGTLRKGVGMPFSMVSDVSLATDGRIRLHPLNVKVLGIPSIGLMKLFGTGLGGLITLKAQSGIEVEGDDLFLTSDRLLTAPRIEGRLTGVRLEADRLVEVFGPPRVGAPLVPPDRAAQNYLYFRGGTLRFGRMTMTDADLDIVDDAPEGAFEFSLPHYREQLVVGYSKTTISGGLIVHMPNYQPPVAPGAPRR
jgi:hypothetical protein